MNAEYYPFTILKFLLRFNIHKLKLQAIHCPRIYLEDCEIPGNLGKNGVALLAFAPQIEETSTT
jgi:hypothetical protein